MNSWVVPGPEQAKAIVGPAKALAFTTLTTRTAMSELFAIGSCWSFGHNI